MAQENGPQSPVLRNLTPAQLEAVTHFEGPLLILAGAGSGKTRVITRRVAWLIGQGVRPSSILAITFTNKAAGEMKERIQALAPECRAHVSTFHSLGAKLLRVHADRLGFDRNFTIYDMDDRKKLLKDVMDTDVGVSTISPDQAGAAISKAKNQLTLPAQFSAYDFFTETVSRAYAIYQRRLRAANAVDFDDLLLLPALALRTDADLRTELNSRYRFLLIDEYQDTNVAQYEFARLISVEHRNICVVGDPDQSIYKFRGSDIRNILDFEKDFPDARTITLEQNFRSTKAILHAASVLIDHNRQRKPKVLITDNPQGRPVRATRYGDGFEEANRVVESIRENVASGKRCYSDHAIFLRTNALSRTIESAFMKLGVPYQMVRGLAFYERKENKDILAYLRLLVNPKDDLAFVRAIGEPARGVGKTSLDYLRTYAEPRELSLLQAAGEAGKVTGIKGKAAAGLRHFHQLMVDLAKFAEHPPGDVVSTVIERSGYGAMLKATGTDEDQERYENIQELVTAAEQFGREDGSRTIADFLETISLASDVDAWDEKQDCVSVMTLHSAKGLEFPVVFVVAMEQGMLPHARSLESADDIEEERRLCFVGMTRAKEELNLSSASYREFGGQHKRTMESDFLHELPAEVERIDQAGTSAPMSTLSYYRGGGGPAARAGWDDTGISHMRPKPKDDLGFFVGALVEHNEYGRGMIVDLNGVGAMRMVRVRFKEGLKVFNANHAKLTVVEED